MPEMTSIIIAGLAMWVTELCKRKGMDKFYVPVIAFAAAGLFSFGWEAVFDASVGWRTALKDGFALGAMTGGLYGFGKMMIDKSTSKPNINE